MDQPHVPDRKRWMEFLDAISKQSTNIMNVNYMVGWNCLLLYKNVGLPLMYNPTNQLFPWECFAGHFLAFVACPMFPQCVEHLLGSWVTCGLKPKCSLVFGAFCGKQDPKKSRIKAMQHSKKYSMQRLAIDANSHATAMAKMMMSKTALLS